MKKTTTVTLVSAVIVSAIMVMLWTGFGEDNKHLPLGKNDLSSTETETEVDTDEGDLDEESQPVSTAKRIVRVPGKKVRTSTSRRVRTSVNFKAGSENCLETCRNP